MQSESKNVVSIVNNCYKFFAIVIAVVDIKRMLNRASNGSCCFIPREGNMSSPFIGSFGFFLPECYVLVGGISYSDVADLV